jgi:glycosyltransferase involved in cell wall biosynthesis
MIEKNKKIKILFIMDFIFSVTGGTENQILKILNNLDDNKFEKTLLCLKNTPWLNENYDNICCNVLSLNYNVESHLDPKNLLVFVKLINRIKYINPDIVITFFPTSYMIGVMAAKIAGIKNILSTRRDYGLWLVRKNKIPLKIANFFLSGIITNSELVKDLVVKKEKFDYNKVDVIYNGISIKNTPLKENELHNLKKKYKIPENKKIIGIVAGLRPMKNHQTLINAAAILKSKRSDIIYLIVGDGARREELESLVDQLSLSNEVYFLGWQKEIKKVLSLFNIGVNCSGNEGLSNAIMEYMGYGIPCIVSDSGGNTELIQDQINGMVFKTKDENELAEKILLLLENKNLQNQFIIKSKEIINSQFSINTMVTKYEKYFLDLIYN